MGLNSSKVRAIDTVAGTRQQEAEAAKKKYWDKPNIRVKMLKIAEVNKDIDSQKQKDDGGSFVEAYSGHTDFTLYGEEGRAMKRYCVADDNSEDQDTEVSSSALIPVSYTGIYILI